MKKTIILSIILLGITSVIGQLIIIRETTINFYGNEFFIGWILFSWLFWTGIGSLLIAKLFALKKPSNILVSCHFLIAVFLIVILPVLRIFGSLNKIPTGQIPDLIPAMLYTFFVLAPLGIFLGLQFTVATKFWNEFIGKDKTETIVSAAYFWETVGFILGGAVFTYVLAFANNLDTIFILGWLNIILGTLLIFKFKKKALLKTFALMLIFFTSTILMFSQNIDRQTQKLHFPNQTLIESKNSEYGNIAVTQTKNQYNFFESGLFLGTSGEILSSEYVHLPLLYCPNPQKILLIGNGFNGILKEIFKYQPQKVYYLEIDPKLIETIKKYLFTDLSQYLNDSRVQIIHTDARYFIKSTSEKFDVIIVNLPNPSTALINRFYTEEFFNEAKKHLSETGILSTRLDLSENYFGPETENLDSSLYQALKNNFYSVLIFPEEQHLFIASQKQLDTNPENLIQLFKEKNIKTNFFNEAFIKYVLTNGRGQELLSLINEKKAIKTNQDQNPIGYYFNLVYWISSLHPGLAKVFSLLTKIKFVWIIGLLTVIWILFLGGLWIRNRRDPSNSNNIQITLISIFAMATAGFSLMAMEMIIVLGFQIFYGNLYYKLAVIITSVMLGLALGNFIATKNIRRFKTNSVAKIHILIALCSLVTLLGFYFLFKISPVPSMFIEILFVISTVIFGTVVGFEFPVVNKLYLEKQKNTGKKTGIIYGADLLGSCLGASLIGIFFIPLFGIFQTVIFLIILNFLVALAQIILYHSRQRPEQ